MPNAAGVHAVCGVCAKQPGAVWKKKGKLFYLERGEMEKKR